MERGLKKLEEREKTLWRAHERHCNDGEICQ